MANPKWTKAEIQQVTISDDGIIQIGKRKAKHKPFVLSVTYPAYMDSNWDRKAYTKHYRFAKLQGALDIYKHETVCWKVRYNAQYSATFTLVNEDTKEELTYLLKGETK
jgi:hypothetical protein